MIEQSPEIEVVDNRRSALLPAIVPDELAKGGLYDLQIVVNGGQERFLALQAVEVQSVRLKRRFANVSLELLDDDIQPHQLCEMRFDYEGQYIRQREKNLQLKDEKSGRASTIRHAFLTEYRLLGVEKPVDTV